MELVGHDIYTQIALEELLPKLSKNSELLYALLLGNQLRQNLDCYFRIECNNQQWDKFMSNISLMLDITNPKLPFMTFEEYTIIIGQMYPTKYYPNIALGLESLAKLDINNFTKIVEFNKIFKYLFSAVCEFFESSNFATLLKNKTHKQLTFIKSPSIVGIPSKSSSVYTLANTAWSSIVSIDIIRANFTFLFQYIGSKLCTNIDDFGMDFNELYDSIDEFKIDITWDKYIRHMFDWYNLNASNLTKCIIDLMSKSKKFRGLSIGLMSKKLYGLNLGKILEDNYRNYMRNVVLIIKPLIELSGGKIICVSADEIVIANINESIVRDIIASVNIEDKWIIEKFAKIYQFKLSQYDVSGKTFYVKTGTNVTFHCLEPPIRIDAMKMF